MGKKNHLKRRELEKQQSISGKKKIKTVKPNRKELQNLKEFGTVDGDLLETFDKDKSNEFEGRSWTFDSKGELIDGEDETKKEQNENKLTLLNIPTNLNNIQLGKSSSVIPITNKTKSPFSKLLSNLGVNKKKFTSEKKTITGKAPIAREKETEDSQEQEVLDPLVDTFSDEEIIPEDVLSSSDDESSNKKGLPPKDPYEVHFGDLCYGTRLSSLIEAVKQKLWNTVPLTQASQEGEIQAFLTTPKVESDNDAVATDLQKVSSKLTTLKLSSICVKPRLIDPWVKFISKSKLPQEKNSDFSLLQTPFFYHINKYRDVYYPLLDFNCETELRASYILHTLNHVYKTRDRIIKNTVKITKLQEDKISRDSGFTRPKVLILLPFRSSAVKLVDLLYRLSGCEQQENRKRFKTEFGIPDGTEDPILRSKTSEEHRKIFAGNSDDCFRFGIKFTRKAMKLFSPFYNSDVIIASPLGLRLVVGDSKDQVETIEKSSDKKKRPKRKDHDFLSSIEIMILDQADHLIMQNWDHTLHINKHSNIIPNNPHDCDFSRVKSWYLEGQSKYLRQTIVLSTIMTPELNSFMRTSNVAGQVHFRATTPSTISDVRLPSKQTFHRISCLNHSEADDKRFQYFIDNVLANIRRKASAGVQSLVFIPSYFDFTRVRNYLTDHEYSFGQASEYSEISTLTRDRQFFASKKLNLFLYTERSHFYRRYKIKGADQIVFYGLPEYGQFYPELIEMCNTPDAAGLEPVVQVTALFTVYDSLKLERILGPIRAQKACHGALSTLVFS